MAAISSSFKVTLTPTLMLGEKTMAMSWLAACISAFCDSEKPVVPITICTPIWRHTATCVMVPSGRVKSISTCAFFRPCARSAVIKTPLLCPVKALASLPMDGLAAMSKAPASWQSGASAMASISMRPMRPLAPATAIRRGVEAFMAALTCLRVQAGDRLWAGPWPGRFQPALWRVNFC